MFILVKLIRSESYQCWDIVGPGKKSHTNKRKTLFNSILPMLLGDSWEQKRFKILKNYSLEMHFKIINMIPIS